MKKNKEIQTKAFSKMLNWPTEVVRCKQTTVIPKDYLTCLLNILLTYHFEVIWAFLSLSDKAQSICYSGTKKWLHVLIHFWDIIIFGFLQSDKLRACCGITQELEF